jgi:predicted transcriptional regulator
VIRFDDEGRSKRPVFPYDDLVISPLAHDDSDPAVTMS